MKKNCAIIGLCCIYICLAPPATAQKRIAIMGSSTSAGYFPPASGFPKDSAYAWKLKKYYKDLGVIDTLFNIAQSSTDCYTGMPGSYTPPAGRPMPNSNLNITRAVNLLPKPDVIIVNYPSNGYDTYSIAEIMFCLQTIKDSANENNIVCYITSSQPRDGFSPSERVKLGVIRDSIMNRFGSFAIDFFTEIVNPADNRIKTEYAIGDGVHLNPEGHTILKNKVLDKNIFFVLVPVKFSAVKVAAHADGNLLQWDIENVLDRSRFIIESSIDGLTYYSIGQLPANNSNNTARNHYSYLHKLQADGRVYYRVAAVDPSGRKEFSEIVSIENSIATGEIRVINGNNVLQLIFPAQLSRPAVINILSADGRIISNKQLEGNNASNYFIDISGYRPGKYVLQVFYHGKKQAIAFIKP